MNDRLESCRRGAVSTYSYCELCGEEDLRITENSRLAMAAAAIRERITTLNRARDFWP